MKNVQKCVYTMVSLLFLFTSCLTYAAPASSPPPKQDPVLQESEEAAELPARIVFAEELKEYIIKEQWDAALALFDTLDEAEAETTDIQNLKIAVLISMGNIQDAEYIAKTIEKKEPRNIEILYTLTMIAQSKNDSKMRNSYLDKILKIDPFNVQALHEQGLDLYAQGNYKAAGMKFTAILKKHPDNVEALIWLGKINYMLNALKEAEECYTIALKHEPDNSLAIAELARIKSETNRMAEAIHEIQRATVLEPDGAHHWTDLGSYYLQIGRKPEALDAFNRAIALVPDSYFVHIYLAGLYDDLGNKEKARYHYVQVTKLYPQYYFAYESLGVLLFEQKDWAGAESAFRSALGYTPDNTSYALMAGICAYKQGKKKEAKELLQKYLKTINREQKETDYFLCRLFIDFAGDTDVYNRLAKEKDASVKLKKSFYLAAFYQLTGKWTLAEKAYIDIKVHPTPNFFEYRLALSELAHHE